MIIADRLKKYYGKNCGVENVSFSIAPGEIYGLIGPNGAGKTTTIRILLGLLKMDSGSVSIGGAGVPEHLGRVKSAVGYLPGEVNFYGEMRVKEFLKFNRGFYQEDLQEYEDVLVEHLVIDREKKFK
ncbi:MAG: ATP-binding cassette domain-containing protein [Kosmotogaceae bacterium]|nr:ATP-binding cassette domain-containing protein [Kosmotogaceae bacterium]